MNPLYLNCNPWNKIFKIHSQLLRAHLQPIITFDPMESLIDSKDSPHSLWTRRFRRTSISRAAVPRELSPSTAFQTRSSSHRWRLLLLPARSFPSLFVFGDSKESSATFRKAVEQWVTQVKPSATVWHGRDWATSNRSAVLYKLSQKSLFYPQNSVWTFVSANLIRSSGELCTVNLREPEVPAAS